MSKKEALASLEYDVQALNDSVASITLKLEKDGIYNYNILSLFDEKEVNGNLTLSFEYQGKVYKPILKACFGKDVEKLRIDSLYKENDVLGFDMISEVAVCDDNPRFCSVDGVLYSKDMTRLVWCPSVKTGRFQVPASVKTISAGAFFESRLSEVVLPKGLVEIEDCAFCNCKNLYDVVLPASVEIVGISAFDFQSNDGNGYYGSSVSGLEINTPRRNYSIPRNSKLRKVGLRSFPFGVRLYLPKTMTELPENYDNAYFEVDADNPAFSAENGVLFNKDKTVLISFPYKSDSCYCVPASVRTIGKKAFANNHSLKTLDMGENVRYIGKSAFYNCNKMKKFVLPAGLDSMNALPGIECDEIEIADSNPNYCTIGGVLYSKDKKTLLIYPNGKKDSVFEVPAFVKELGPDAFFRCESIRTIRFYDSIESVGDCALASFGIREIIVLTDVKKLGKDFFGAWDGNEESDVRNKIAHKYAWGIFRYENEVEAYLPPLLFEKYGNEGFKITRDMR